MSTTDYAKQIRTTLKAKHGWTSRQVSVRAEYFSMGSAIEVVIKDPCVPITAVKAVAEQAERIDRCQATGEILGGGNRYVNVSYNSDAMRVRAAAYLPAVEKAIAQIENSSLIEVEGTPYLIGKNQWDQPTLWGDNHLCECSTAEGIAQQIACRLE